MGAFIASRDGFPFTVFTLPTSAEPEPVKLRQQLSNSTGNKKLAKFDWKIWMLSGTWWSLQ